MDCMFLATRRGVHSSFLMTLRFRRRFSPRLRYSLHPPHPPEMTEHTPPVVGVAAPDPRAFWTMATTCRESICVITEDGSCLSRADLQAKVDRLKESLDCPHKALVFVLCRNDLPSLAAYLACLQKGHAILLLPHDMEVALLESLAATYRPDFIWSPRSRDHEGYRPEAGSDLDEHRLYGSRERAGHPPIHPDLALLLSTSGSTGNPKLVRLSYANLQANAASIAEYLGLGEGERPITSLPMHYSYGLSVINSHLLAGSTILLTGRKIRSQEFWTFFKANEATSMAGVPYVYQMLREIGFEEMELPSLRTLTQAGGHLDVGLQQHFVEWARQRNIRYYTMYGQTEATARIAYLPPDRAAEGLGSIGVPIPGGKIEIVDGELVYSGPNVMLGYAEHRDDLANGDELKGRLHTGDIARIDDRGLCHIVGRKKRFIKIMGLRVNCDDVERQLSDEFGRGFVVLGTDSHLTVAITAGGIERDIVDFIRRTYHVKGSLCSVRIVAEFPMLPAGKVDYATLNRQIEHDAGSWQRAAAVFSASLDHAAPAGALQSILDLGSNRTLRPATGAA